MHALRSEAIVVASAPARSRWKRASQVLGTVVVASALATSWAVAEDKSPDKAKGKSSMELLREKLEGDEKPVVAQQLELTDGEAKAFWPLYDAYKQELEKLNTRIGAVIYKYMDVYAAGPIAPDLAKSLLAELVEIEKAELDHKLAHIKKVGKVLPPSKMVRYVQLENKIRAILKYDLAAQIPIAKK